MFNIRYGLNDIDAVLEFVESRHDLPVKARPHDEHDGADTRPHLAQRLTRAEHECIRESDDVREVPKVDQG